MYLDSCVNLDKVNWSDDAVCEKIKRDLFKCPECYFKNETREQDHYQGIRSISTPSLIDGAENKPRMEEWYLVMGVRLGHIAPGSNLGVYSGSLIFIHSYLLLSSLSAKFCGSPIS